MNTSRRDTSDPVRQREDSLAARMLPVVEAFEAALRRGEAPDVQRVVADWDEQDREALRRELQRIQEQCSTAMLHSEKTAVSGESVERHSLVGRFSINEFHARGGLGEVYRAVDTELNREVAFKRMQDQYADDDWLKR